MKLIRDFLLSIFVAVVALVAIVTILVNWQIDRNNLAKEVERYKLESEMNKAQADLTETYLHEVWKLPNSQAPAPNPPKNKK